LLYFFEFKAPSMGTRLPDPLEVKHP
jgi:hypothetical protein